MNQHTWATAPYPGAPPSECLHGCGCKVRPVGSSGSVAYSKPGAETWGLEEPQCVERADDTSSLNEDWNMLLPGIQINRMTDDQLRTFVHGVLDGSIFTSAQVQEQHLLSLIFMPVAFGVLSKYNPESLKSIGVLYENFHEALPRGVNGYPIFGSMRMLHVDDWKRALTAIRTEEERRKNIPI